MKKLIALFAIMLAMSAGSAVMADGCAAGALGKVAAAVEETTDEAAATTEAATEEAAQTTAEATEAAPAAAEEA